MWMFGLPPQTLSRSRTLLLSKHHPVHVLGMWPSFPSSRAHTQLSLSPLFLPLRHRLSLTSWAVLTQQLQLSFKITSHLIPGLKITYDFTLHLNSPQDGSWGPVSLDPYLPPHPCFGATFPQLTTCNPALPPVTAHSVPLCGLRYWRRLLA